MLQFDKNGKASLYPHKIKYTRDGESHEQWALPDKEWWIEFEKKWNDMTIIEFTEVELTPEQLQRFESIKDFIVDGYGFGEYILNGEFPAGILGGGTPEEPRKVSLEEIIDFVKENFKK